MYADIALDPGSPHSAVNHCASLIHRFPGAKTRYRLSAWKCKQEFLEKSKRLVQSVVAKCSMPFDSLQIPKESAGHSSRRFNHMTHTRLT